ncbi:MAG: 30S ribosome-binding factor RbfA [bacterium]
MVDYPRSVGVAELIQNELGELLLRHVKDPRVRGVRITRVEVSPDLGQAKAHFSRYGEERGGEEELEEGLRGLERAAGFLQGKLGERLRLRRTPQLRFYIDRSLAQSDHIERLIQGLREESAGEGGA